jgi:hypothetical protein
MAHSDNSVITGKLSGSLGKELVFREWDGKTVVAKSPKKRTKEPSADQLDIQRKFLIASRYATAVKESPDQSMAKAYARVLKPRQNVFSRAMEDFLTLPVVETIKAGSYKGLVGDKITIIAVDDYRVTNVRVEIIAANGIILETGNAVMNPSGIDWIYTATQANNLPAGSKIKAFATDVPGNEGMLEVTV